jgi:hypothetical protein
MSFLTNNAEAMRINAAGIVTKPYQPSFMVRPTSDLIQSSAGAVTYAPNSANHNIGNHFDLSNNRFVAPVDGVYHFTALARFNDIGSQYHVARFYKNTSVGIPGAYGISEDTGNYNTVAVSADVLLSANDTVILSMYASSDGSWSIDSNSHFSGHLIG